MVFTLRAWRRAKGFTLKGMAEAIGINPSTYQAWEQRPWKIRAMYIERITDVLGVQDTDIADLYKEVKKNEEED